MGLPLNHVEPKKEMELSKAGGKMSEHNRADLPNGSTYYLAHLIVVMTKAGPVLPDFSNLEKKKPENLNLNI